ncbi:MAG: hypothetical protein K2Y51_25135, partial [Gammaproteobacteria bacterium]|nr:hypothetical protein [Gammaproteobacteria bacterium]
MPGTRVRSSCTRAAPKSAPQGAPTGVAGSLVTGEARKNAFNQALNHRSADDMTRFVPLESKFTTDIV